MAITRDQLKVNEDYVNKSDQRCTVLYIGETEVFYDLHERHETCWSIKEFCNAYSLAPKPKKKIKLIGYMTKHGCFVEYSEMGLNELTEDVKSRMVRVSTRELEIDQDSGLY